MDKKISVAIPAYKSNFLKKAINSVLNQTYLNFELIIVNDHSPDNIDEIVQSFTDKRIRYYKNSKNLGKESVVKSWNKCLEYASAPYFALFSDDDIYEPTFLEEMIRLCEKYPDVDLFHCRVKQIDAGGNVLSFTPTCPEHEDVLDFIWHTLKGHRTQYAPDFFCKTSALRNIGGFYDLPLAWGSDYITWFQIASENGVVYSKKPLCNWRNSSYNISKVGDVSKRLDAIFQFKNWINKFINTYNPKNNLEIELLKQIKTNNEHIFIKKRNNLIFLNAINQKFIKHLFKMFKLKKKHKIPFNVISHSLIKSIS